MVCELPPGFVTHEKFDADEDRREEEMALSEIAMSRIHFGGGVE